MFNIENTKNLSLNSYNKRKFSEDFLYTEPFSHTNLGIYK